MKKLFILMASLILLVACTNEQTKNEEKENENSTSVQEKKEVQSKDDKSVDEVKKEEDSKIDTSVFKYAKNVEVTDARDITKHLTLKIDLSDDAQPGMGTLNILNQAYDFLQQEDIKGADTITIFVRVKDIKVSQFKINTSQFKPNDQESMANVVLKAAEIEHLSPEVKEFGQTMELWK